MTPSASALPARRTRLPPLLELRSFGGGAWQAGQGLAIVHYGFTLKCLANESLQLVQNSGHKKSDFALSVSNFGIHPSPG